MSYLGFYNKTRRSVSLLAATTANCWSEKCGLKFFKEKEMYDTYEQMNTQLDTFTIRTFIDKVIICGFL